MAAKKKTKKKERYVCFGPTLSTGANNWVWQLAEDRKQKGALVIIDRRDESHFQFLEEGYGACESFDSDDTYRLLKAIVDKRRVHRGDEEDLDCYDWGYDPGYELRIGCKYIYSDLLTELERFIREEVGFI